MGKLVVLKLGDGSFEQGFPVTLQIGQDGARPEVEITGKLPPQSEIPKHYSNWQSTYRRLGSPSRLTSPAVQVTNVSVIEDCGSAAQLLHDSFNTWLCAESFRPLREKLLEKLMPADEVRVILQTEDIRLQRLPWHLWDLFERYPFLEIALSAPGYEGVVKHAPAKKAKVKILAILGNSTGIDTQADRAMLKQLPNAEIHFLVEPQRQELTDRLWEQSWDILFFAGHSSSSENGEKGRIFINSVDSLTIDRLKYAVSKAVARGLRIAIFNSCDGLGLARELADLQVPQLVVMREPVPDRVAQEFLKYFLAGFTGGKSFYLAVREARERLQGLEDRFPCATWLPVICQNPAEVPPTWEECCGGRSSQPSARHRWRTLQAVFLTSVASASLLLGLRWFGMLQPSELWAFDRLLRLRPNEGSDPRLLVITINAKDIQAQEQRQRGISLSDSSLDRLLKKLEQYQPRAIGLDIYRDFPVSPDHQDLVARLKQNDRFVAICKGKDPEHEFNDVAPPPEVPRSRLGFSDFVQDADGILRRHLLFMSPDPISSCTAPYAFNLQLAFLYLHYRGISPEFTSEGNLQFGSTVFKSLKERTGGYQNVDAGGNQVLLNYRSLSSPEKIATQVTLAQILSDRVNPDTLKDRVVLIGVTDPNKGDYWSTPYGRGPSDKIPGVFIHAHMVSQILSAVLDERPLLSVWPLWREIIWIWFWSGAGAIFAWRFHRLAHLGLASAAAVLTLSGFCLIFLLQGWWIPLVPSLLAFLVAIGAQIASKTSTNANKIEISGD